MPGKTTVNIPDTIDGVFRAFEGLKVLIIGDVMIDSYLWGKVDRISPEAPVPIVNVQQKDKRLGGAANVALNIQALGATPLLCTVIGNDPDGDDFVSILQKNGISDKGVIRSAQRITSIKHRIISGSQHMLRVDSEMDTPLSNSDEDLVLHQIEKLASVADVIIFQDYDKGVITEKVIRESVKSAQKLNIPTVTDPKKRNFLSYNQVSLFKPNRKELKEGLKLDSPLSEIKEVEEAVLQLKKQLNTETVLITLSEKGIFIDSENQKHWIPAHLREICDVSGAGDTVISVAALCKALQLPPHALASLSNLAGGIVCEQVGVVPVNKEKFVKEAQKLQLF
ncbi:bifunctional ADP-heptose synthase [Cytophagaceae bacterium ABcell3]|nr:bifunctional ADP-heptose synthase [Cytophagaceae bacterium ABcell3]